MPLIQLIVLWNALWNPLNQILKSNINIPLIPWKPLWNFQPPLTIWCTQTCKTTQCCPDNWLSVFISTCTSMILKRTRHWHYSLITFYGLEAPRPESGIHRGQCLAHLPKQVPCRWSAMLRLLFFNIIRFEFRNFIYKKDFKETSLPIESISLKGPLFYLLCNLPALQWCDLALWWMRIDSGIFLYRLMQSNLEP